MDNDIFVLIGGYVTAVRSAVERLHARLGSGSLLATVHRNSSLRSGVLSSGETYSFHGIGCRVTVDGRTLDFDFGPEDRVDGFDGWRLWLFAIQDPNSFDQWKDRARIEQELIKLRTDGFIETLGQGPSPHLYYLTEAGKNWIEMKNAQR